MLEGHGEQRCVQLQGVRTCVFPTALSLDVRREGATFTLRVAVDKPGQVTLPGSTEHFPLDVRLDKKPIAVLDGGGLPNVWLERGTHTLTGTFRFRSVPDTLQLPPNLALLQLSVDGTRIAQPKRDASGLVWLKQIGDGGEEERLNLSVHRRLEDGVPVRVVTRMHVSAAGKGREIVLPSILLAGTRPIELRTSLPAELTAEGTLRMQVQAGEHDVELVAIRETSEESFSAPRASEPWPERELWVVRSDDRLRHVEISGPAQIDPARTDLSPDWRGLPTYVMPAGQSLKLETRRRGEPEPAPNQLHLARTLWLDLDGDGYTVRDQLSGTMNRAFRLDMAGATLGHALDHGQDQLVTLHEKKSGVELRQRKVQLQTEWRMEHGQRELPAVGYDENLESLRADLHLPPGFLLLGAEGVDRLPGTWLDSWDLFDFFFVLLVSLAVAKLAGSGFGALALLALVLTHHEPDAPTVSWVFLLAATALLLAFKQERFAKVVRLGWLLSLVCVLLVLLPFSVMQVRKALYPHLDHTYVGWNDLSGFAARSAVAPEPAPMEPPGVEVAIEEAAGGAVEAPMADQLGYAPDQAESPEWLKRRSGHRDEEGAMGGGKRVANSSSAAYKVELDPSAVVQTGPGLPSWQFRHYSLSWSGPVQKDQRIQLWIAPPLLMRLWALASVLCSGLLLLALALASRKAQGGSEPPPPAQASSSSRAQGTIITMLVLLGVLTVAPRADAQALPSGELLDQLRARLLQEPACAPDCLSVSTLALRIEAGRLVLRAEVHAQANATYQAPGPLDSWTPDSVRVDGKDALAAARSGDGFLHVRVDAGVHQVELSGPLPRSQAFTLALGTPPHQVTAEHPGYLVEGLREDGRAEGSLSIRREVRESDRNEQESQGLLQWFEVRRELELGVRFRIRTTVSRLGPASESALLRIPLLPGEEVNEAGLASDAQGVVVELPRGEQSKSFASGLQPRAEIKLVAATPNASRPFSEVWVVSPSVLYRPSFDGIAPVEHVGPDGTYRPTFRPFPGESVTLRAARLSGAEGASVTVDSAQATFSPGSRMEQVTLNWVVRTSRGTSESIALPQGAILSSVSVDGVNRPARVQGGKLELHLDPGERRIVVNLQRAQGMTFAYRPMTLAGTRPLGNVTSEVRMPDGRWLLWAHGPAWGPAVLFWGYLLVVLLCAVALGRVASSPLKTHEWCLLGLGLTQVEAPIALLIVGWLFALAYRQRHPIEHRLLFNFSQVVLVGLSVLALVLLGYAVHRGLVVQPSMQVEGMGSSDQLLRWYTDRTQGAFPQVTVWSAPLWIYKALMLLWALWLAASVIRWLRWGLAALRSGGGWRPRGPGHGTRANPRVNLDAIEAAEAELRRAQEPPPSGDRGPEGAGIP